MSALVISISQVVKGGRKAHSPFSFAAEALIVDQDKLAGGWVQIAQAVAEVAFTSTKFHHHTLVRILQQRFHADYFSRLLFWER